LLAPGPHGAPTSFATLLEASRPGGTLAGAPDEDACAPPASPVCSSTAQTSEGDSLAEKVAAIIGLLALTGLSSLPLAAAALILTVAGSIALDRGRRRRPILRS
jgi:hypothetical protein